MGIEMREAQNSENTANQDLSNCTVVAEVTVDMILNDLAQGRNKEQIRQKYAYKDENGTVRPFEKWMVDQMFKDPSLRGKKPARRKVLPFQFKGTTTSTVTPAEPNTVIEVVEQGTHPYPDEPKHSIPGTEGGHQFNPPTNSVAFSENGVDFDID